MKEYFDRKYWSLFIAACLMLTGLSMYWTVLAFSDTTRSRMVALSSKPVILLMGLAIGLGFATAIFTWIHSVETERFQKEIRELRFAQHRRVRLPFSRRTITHEEFRAMWGDDDPDTYRPNPAR